MNQPNSTRHGPTHKVIKADQPSQTIAYVRYYLEVLGLPEDALWGEVAARYTDLQRQIETIRPVNPDEQTALLRQRRRVNTAYGSLKLLTARGLR